MCITKDGTVQAVLFVSAPPSEADEVLFAAQREAARAQAALQVYERWGYGRGGSRGGRE